MYKGDDEKKDFAQFEEDHLGVVAERHQSYVSCMDHCIRVGDSSGHKVWEFSYMGDIPIEGWANMWQVFCYDINGGVIFHMLGVNNQRI